MKTIRKAELVLWTVLLGALPGWANNAPRPDGIFAIILIFPVVLIGFRLAGAKLTEKERKWRLLRGLVFTLCVLLALAGTGLAGIPLLIFLCYGIIRGVQIISRGQGSKRFIIAAVVILFTLFAVTDYFVSLSVHSAAPANEYTAIRTLGIFATAEESFKAAGLQQKPGTPGRYGALEDLRKAKLVDETYAEPRLGYTYSVTPSADGQHYFMLAVPYVYAEADVLPTFVPGTSLRWMMRSGRTRGVGHRCFAMDESGVVRSADVGPVKTVSREVAMRWPPL